MDLTNITKPFLKWVGGKTQIIGDIMELVPTHMNNYHEPFVGGGSVLLAVLSGKQAGVIDITGKLYASDANGHLINLYKVIQADCDGLLVEMDTLMDQFGKSTGTTVNRAPATFEEACSSQESYYYWTRSQFNKQDTNVSPCKAAAMFLFLNKTCFRGVYREGPNGFNVPYGHYKNPGIVNHYHIRNVSTLIQDVVFAHASFGESLKIPLEGDFVYLDPPYAPETDKSFVGYTAAGFCLRSHTTLFACCEDLHQNNIGLLMSNACVKLVTDAFVQPKYKTKVISCRRAINSKKPDAKTNEVLITNL